MFITSVATIELAGRLADTQQNELRDAFIKALRIRCSYYKPPNRPGGYFRTCFEVDDETGGAHVLIRCKINNEDFSENFTGFLRTLAHEPEIRRINPAEEEDNDDDEMGLTTNMGEEMTLAQLSEHGRYLNYF